MEQDALFQLLAQGMPNGETMDTKKNTGSCLAFADDAGK
jgi:hypothetical protein